MKKILLVDDSTFARNNMKRMLGDRYEILEASDGLEGLEAYFLNHPDLVILDITMPGASGLDVLEQIRKVDPQARVVMCSADVQEYSRARASELGALGFIGKPVTAENLLTIVSPLLDEAGG